MTNNHSTHQKLSRLKRTKIVATVGPATASAAAIEEMMAAGVNGFRFNFSHNTPYEQFDKQIEWIRKAQKKQGKHVAIIQDLQGPKIRLGDFDGSIHIAKHQALRFQYNCTYVEGGPIPTQYDLSKKVKRGERVQLYDGRIRTVVTSVKDGIVYVEAQNEGSVSQRKGINLPDTDFKNDILTVKDKRDIAYGATQDIDFVALSFIQSAQDVELLRRLLKNHGSHAKIIAKIETKAAVDDIDEIVKAADAVMVARGDLAIETEPEIVPIVQRQIVAKCMEHKKMAIVATQMLASMADGPEPTRAEVADVSAAVIMGTDAVMLSEETAIGKYPIESIQMMKRIILYSQHHMPVKPIFFKEDDKSIQGSIGSAIITLAHQVKAEAIVAETSSGSTALTIASHRPSMPMYVVTPNSVIAQQLAILYGARTFVRPVSKYAATKLTTFLRSKDALGQDDIVVISSGKYPGKVGSTDTIKVRRLD